MKTLKEGGAPFDPIRPGHYHSHGITPFDFVKALTGSFDAFEGGAILAIIKYITRFKQKNGVEDLKKAKEYLESLIEHEETKSVS